MTDRIPDEKLNEIEVLLEKATPRPWSYELCGEKGQGAAMIGVSFHLADTDCSSPIEGQFDSNAEAVYDEKIDEWVFPEYYRDELVAECDFEGISRNPNENAALITAAVNAIGPLIKELRALRAAAEWKPIETAPMDWSTILLFCPDSPRNDGGVCQGYFAAECEGDSNWHAEDREIIQPTHWRPLPTPPQGSAS